MKGILIAWLKSLLTPNPIVVREVRQAVRNKFVVAVLMLMITVLVSVTGFFILVEQLAAVIDTHDFEAGRGLFRVLLAVLSTGCILFVPLYTAIRMFIERTGENMDLLYITSMQPSKIIRGKVFASGVITLLLFSLCAPFMAFTFLLRGIDLPTIFCVLGLLYLIVILAVQVALFMMSLPTSRVFRMLLMLPLLVALIWVAIASNVVSYEWVFSGIPGGITSWSFWGPMLLGLGIGLTFFSICYACSVALISPVSANRALPLRIWLTVCWLAWGISIVSIALYYGEAEIMLAWLIMSTALGLAGLFAAVSENDCLSPRVRRSIPNSMLLRVPALFFYSGPLGGILWICTLFMIAFSVSGMVMNGIGMSSHSNDAYKYLAVAAGFFLYFYCYALSASLIVRAFLSKKIPRYSTWVISLLLMAAVVLGMSLLAWLVEKDNIWENIGRWQFGNPLGLFDADYRGQSLLGALGWAVVVTALNLPWFRSQIKSFRPM